MRMKPRGPTWALVMIAVASVALILVLVGEYTRYNREEGFATRVPSTMIEPEPGEGLRAQIETFLPAGTAVLTESRADLDGDTIEETVAAFNGEDQPFAPGAGGVLVLDLEGNHLYKAWQARPSSEGRVTELMLQDINADGDLEILLYKATEDEAWQYLHIYDWHGSGYTDITPRGGPLDGMEAFSSAYYPPDFSDVDMDGFDELLAYEEMAAYERLKVLVHVWDGETFVYDDLAIVLGPRRP